MPARRMTGGYLDDRLGPRAYTKRVGDLVVRVQNCGLTWGFTVWKGNECVAGRQDWGWSMFDAAEQAEAYAARVEGGGLEGA